jgi:uncharacterized membrane protein YraQ (UPF0718 family)
MFESLANLVAFRLLRLDSASPLGAAVQFFVQDVTKIFALLVLVIYVMGLLRALLSPERVRLFVRGRPHWQARRMAVTLGAVTPFCSCSSVPLFIGFVEAGVEIELEKVTDMATILGYGVTSTPGVVLDEKVVHTGSIPPPDRVRAWVRG